MVEENSWAVREALMKPRILCFPEKNGTAAPVSLSAQQNKEIKMQWLITQLQALKWWMRESKPDNLRSFTAVKHFFPSIKLLES